MSENFAMWKKFFAGIIFSTLALCVAISSFNIFIDTYNIFDVPKKVGINFSAYKSRNTERFFKPIKIIDRKPKIIFLGNSKGDFGLNPDCYAELTGRDKSEIYNAAIQSGRIFEARNFLEHALKINPDIDRVILGIDFEMICEDSDSMPGFDSEQLRKNHITAKNFFAATLSGDSLKDNIFTLRKNLAGKIDYPVYDDNGKMNEKMIDEIFTAENSFYKNSRYFIANQRRIKNLPDKHIDELKKIVEICRERNIDLQVVILPVHAVQLQSYSLYRPELENILRKVVDVVPVTSFLAYDEISADENNFWDSLHIKKIIGDKVIETLTGREKSFGKIITPENVDEYLSNLWAAGEKFAPENPEVMKNFKFVARFSPEPNFSNLIETDFAEIKRAEVNDFPGGKVFFATAAVKNPEELKEIYAVAENQAGERFFVMCDKNILIGEINLKNIMTGSDDAGSEFVTEAIFDFPPGEYALKIAAVKNSGEKIISSSVRTLKF